jgi:hypothetical protein
MTSMLREEIGRRLCALAAVLLGGIVGLYAASAWLSPRDAGRAWLSHGDVALLRALSPDASSSCQSRPPLRVPLRLSAAGPLRDPAPFARRWDAPRAATRAPWWDGHPPRAGPCARTLLEIARNTLRKGRRPQLCCWKRPCEN